MVRYYDETRVFNEKCFWKAIRYLTKRFPPNGFPKLFEPGIGGRIAIPLAKQGYQVTGIDISKDMLSLLKLRLTHSDQDLPISFHRADVCDLPFSNAKFDIAVAVHLFYFIREWTKAADEILRSRRQLRISAFEHTHLLLSHLIMFIFMLLRSLKKN